MGNKPDNGNLPLITLRVLGNWESPADLADRLTTVDAGYTLAWPSQPDEGPTLVHDATGQRFEVTVREADDEIAELFEQGGRLSDAEMALLREHKVKVFISGTGGSVDAARAVLRAGAAVIRAGGLGVMVDNNGSTHSPTDWLELAGDVGDGGVYWALVDLTGGPDLVFSVGMHCLGHRDAELPDPPHPGRAMYLLHNLLGYSYRSGVTINDGEAMGSPDGPAYRLRHVPCDRFEPGSPFHNPYGAWRMEAFDGE